MNLVIYFAKTITTRDNTFLFKDNSKWPVYEKLFQSLAAHGISTYLASCTDHFLKEDIFCNPYFFNGKKFEPFEGTVKADILFDRSSSIHLPSVELIQKTFNAIPFKQLCGNKEKTYDLFHDFMPKTISVSTALELEEKLATLPEGPLFVIKPSFGIKGSGIKIDTSSNLLKEIPTEDYPYLLQEFVDTTKGVPAIASSVHDLRFVSANGKIILSALRVPAPGSLLANVAKGGSIKEIPLSNIPEDILETVKKIHSEVETLYPGSCYSMDFGYDATRKQTFLFELNDRIGFPGPSMPNAYHFAEELALSILDFSKKLS